MEVRTLSSRHPLCTSDLFRKYEALYMGGETFRSMVGEFLPKQPQDTDVVYRARLKEASYRPFVGQITRAYAGALFASPFALRAKKGDKEAELDPSYEAFKEDADGFGCDLTNFFKDRFRKALVFGCSYWLVEMPSDAAEMPEESGPEKAARLCPIDTQAVLDWEADEDGTYLWIKVFESALRRPDPSAPAMRVDTWKIYFQDRVDVYQITYDPKKPPRKDQQVPLVDQYDHGCARVPILCMRLPAGLWLLDVASDAQIEHFRLSCALGWALRRCSYPLGVFNLESGARETPLTGPGMGVMLGKDEKFGWAEPSGGALSVLREEIKAQKDEIYRVAQQMAMSADNSSPSAVGRSGLSKLADAAATDSCLRDYAHYARESIEATYELVSNARGELDLTFSVEGMNSFNTQDIETLISLAETAKTLGIEEESDTFRIESHYRLADLLLPSDTQQGVKDEIRKEISRPPPKKEPIFQPNAGNNPFAKGDPTNDESRIDAASPTPANGMEE